MKMVMKKLKLRKNSMSAVFTTETRLSDKDAHDMIEYVRQYRIDYGMIQRYVWHYIVNNHGIPNKSQLNTEIQQRFGVTKRTANSIIYDMSGRYKALKELKKTEGYQYQHKIEHLEDVISMLDKQVSEQSKKAAVNQLSEKQLVSYRNLKKQLYFKRQKLQKYKDRLKQLETDIASEKYRLGFGGRHTFDNQHRLSENGYRSHIGWHNDYVSRRDCNIFYLGSKDESCGNQMFQLKPNALGGYDIQLRKDGRYVMEKKDRYAEGRCSFKYLDDEIRSSLINKDRPMSYRIKIRGRKVYLQAIVTLDAASRPIVTNMCDGAIGIDFNDGHIDLSETDRHGNLVAMKQYMLNFHGTGTKAQNEMRQVISDIGKYALSRGKSIVKEDLSFVKKKSKTDKAKGKTGKRYNKMIHTLDYSRYEADIQNMTTRYGIDLIEVNPVYTSKIAKQKYCDSKKIPIHNGAAFVIARRGQGFKDKYIA